MKAMLFLLVFASLIIGASVVEAQDDPLEFEVAKSIYSDIQKDCKSFLARNRFKGGLGNMNERFSSGEKVKVLTNCLRDQWRNRISSVISKVLQSNKNFSRLRLIPADCSREIIAEELEGSFAESLIGCSAKGPKKKDAIDACMSLAFLDEVLEGLEYFETTFPNGSEDVLADCERRRLDFLRTPRKFSDESLQKMLKKND